MKSVILHQPHQMELKVTEQPADPGVDEVLVRVHSVGICGTDLHAFTGTQPFFQYPRILGHELAVEVLQLGPTTQFHSLQVGDFCCLRPYLNCGLCGPCQRGFENCCINLRVVGVHMDGGMQELIKVPIDKLHKSALLSQKELALVEMLSIGRHAVRRAAIVPDETILVIGAGPIGLGVCQFAHLAGARVIAMDISDSRLAFAARQPAIAHCIDARLDVTEQLNAIIPNDLPTAVLDATGNARSMMNAFQYVVHGGRLVFVGLFQGDVTFHDPDFHRREMTLLASRNATKQDFDEVIAAMEAKQIEVESWITHQVSPEQMIDDFKSWIDPANGVVKAMVHF